MYCFKEGQALFFIRGLFFFSQMEVDDNFVRKYKIKNWCVSMETSELWHSAGKQVQSSCGPQNQVLALAAFVFTGLWNPVSLLEHRGVMLLTVSFSASHCPFISPSLFRLIFLSFLAHSAALQAKSWSLIASFFSLSLPSIHFCWYSAEFLPEVSGFRAARWRGGGGGRTMQRTLYGSNW